MKNTIWVFLLSVLAFASCGDDTEAKKEFKDGVIVVNQGLFQTGTGTLTFKERGSSTVVQDLIGRLYYFGYNKWYFSKSIFCE